MKKSNEIQLEKVDWKFLSPGPLVGVDEVGRGCLAGPVVAGACFLQSDQLVDQLRDSKKLSEVRRDQLAPELEKYHLFGIGIASVEEIDELNILQASLLAMKRAVEELEKKLGEKAGHVLIDGNFRIPNLARKQSTFVQGDSRVAPISAAAIVAKVFRDQWMRKIAKEHPHYGFEAHKGYGSEFHRKQIEVLGVTPWHRKSFKGVREFVTTRS